MRKAIRGHPRGGRPRRADRLPPGALPQPVLLPDRGPPLFRPRRADSRALDRPRWQRSQRSSAWSSSPRCSRSGPRASITTPPPSSTPTADYLGKYRKMHIPDDPQYYEKFYFTPGDLGFRSLGHPVRPHRRAGLLGPVVSRGRPPHRPERARRSSSTPPPSAGSRPRKRSTAPSSRRPGRRSSAATPSPTASTSCAVNRVGHEGTGDGGIEFWGGSFVADPGGRLLAKAGADEEVLTATVRSRQGRRQPHPLALPARPAHRRLRRSHPAGTSIRTVNRAVKAPLRRSRSILMSSADHRPRPRPRLSHARRVGAAPRHLAQLAAQGGFLARQVRSGAGASSPRMVRQLADHEEVHINVAGPDDGGGGAALARRRRRGHRQRLLPPQPDQRCLVPRPRPDLPAARHRRPARAGHRRLGLQRLGRQISALRPRRRDPHPHRATSSGSRCSRPGS